MTPARHANELSTPLVRVCGQALLSAGLLSALLNLTLSPLLPREAGFLAVVTSDAFGVRMPLAAVSAALLTFGCIGLYLVHADRLRLSSLAFLVAGAGGLMAFCAEGVQSTLIRDLAFQAPETLQRLNESGSLRRYDLAFQIGVGTFAIGWLAIAIVIIRTRVLSRRGPLLLIAGMVLAPVLGLAVPSVWGAVAGNVVLGAGWALLGLDLYGAAPLHRER